MKRPASVCGRCGGTEYEVEVEVKIGRARRKEWRKKPHSEDLGMCVDHLVERITRLESEAAYEQSMREFTGRRG